MDPERFLRNRCIIRTVERCVNKYMYIYILLVYIFIIDINNC